MSIADKITSIEGHLTADYEGLENLGCDLTNVNKNIQNIRTCLDNIYSSLPKTTGEGSNLSLSTIKGRINVDDILGDTEQDTTNGYQLFNIEAYESNYATYVDSVDNSSITLQAKTGLNYEQTLYWTMPIELEASTTYTIKRTITTISGTLASTSGQLELYSGSTWKKVLLTASATSGTFSVDTAGTYRIRVKIADANNSSVFKFKLTNFIIYKGTTAHDFEIYTGRNCKSKPNIPTRY